MHILTNVSRAEWEWMVHMPGSASMERALFNHGATSWIPPPTGATRDLLNRKSLST